jgi:hypothetical protein
MENENKKENFTEGNIISEDMNSNKIKQDSVNGMINNIKSIINFLR